MEEIYITKIEGSYDEHYIDGGMQSFIVAYAEGKMSYKELLEKLGFINFNTYYDHIQRAREYRIALSEEDYDERVLRHQI